MLDNGILKEDRVNTMHGSIQRTSSPRRIFVETLLYFRVAHVNQSSRRRMNRKWGVVTECCIENNSFSS